ncbi:very-long-chain 3-oxoacyl-CoA reductase 1-like isoform X2 [Miscanthus floridulus]|uniref:very-long-chain 3-oxoacyl-CoA reductase 1-like isoform X2 n=1 Tax=Miscanthus floridulus TaxID=154761 RepID=UPI00345B298F
MRRLREVVDGLDVGLLVNNAGVAKPCAVYLHEFDVDAWVKMIRVNLWALTEVTAAVLPGMVARRRGAIVNIGSGSTEAIPSFPLYTIYAATKRHVSQFSRSLYVEYRSKGIHIQCQERGRLVVRALGQFLRGDCFVGFLHLRFQQFRAAWEVLPLPISSGSFQLQLLNKSRES